MSGRAQQASIRRASAIRFGMRNHRQLPTPAVAAVGAEPTAGDLRRLRSLTSRTASFRRPARQRSLGHYRRPAGRPPRRRRRLVRRLTVRLLTVRLLTFHRLTARRLPRHRLPPHRLPPRRTLARRLTARPWAARPWAAPRPGTTWLSAPRFRLRDLPPGCLPRLQLRASGQSPGQRPADHQQARKRQNAPAARRVARQRRPAAQGNRASASPGGSSA